MKILIIDDEPLIRLSLDRAFTQKGHEVFQAPDGLSGVKLWKSASFDLILLDVLMPGLSGPEVLLEMGSERKGKVVMMSAYLGIKEDSKQILGVDMFISKPFDNIFTLVQNLEKFCAQ